MLKLFYAPKTIALAPLIALEEAGAGYEKAGVDFAASEQQGPDYLAINPKGRVPVLVTERGILTETPAILTYIAQEFPDAGLAPNGDAYAFAQVQSFNSYLCSTAHVAHAHRTRGNRWTDDNDAIKAMQAKVPEVMSACFELIENEMLQGPWAMGETYTICDPYLFTIAQWMEGDGVDPDRFPKVIAHRTRVGERPAVKRALAN